MSLNTESFRRKYIEDSKMLAFLRSQGIDPEPVYKVLLRLSKRRQKATQAPASGSSLVFIEGAKYGDGDADPSEFEYLGW